MADRYIEDWEGFVAEHGEFLLSHGIPPEALLDSGHFDDFFANGDFDYHDEKVDFEASRLTVQQAVELLDWFREWLRSQNPKAFREGHLLSADVPKHLSRHIEWNAFLDQHGDLLRSSGIPVGALKTERCFEDFYFAGERYGDTFGYDPDSMTKDQAQSLLRFFEGQGYSAEGFQNGYFLGRHIAKKLKDCQE